MKLLKMLWKTWQKGLILKIYKTSLMFSKPARETGGNLVNVIRNSTNIINDKIEIKEEINTLLAAKKFEQKVLSVMPFIMILILSLTTEDYMAPVFDTIVGRIVMTFAINWEMVTWLSTAETLVSLRKTLEK